MDSITLSPSISQQPKNFKKGKRIEHFAALLIELLPINFDLLGGNGKH
jgi:hypothetical protein